MAVITPKLVQTKIYKTGQTRGADDDVIYQKLLDGLSEFSVNEKDFVQVNIYI